MSLLKEQLNNFSSAVRLQYSGKEHEFNQEKINLYHSIAFNNLSSLIEPCFPILRSVLSEEVWLSLLIGLFETVKFRTHIFHRVPFEMVKYLKANTLKNRLFASDLAHYEWLELELELIKIDERVTNYDINLNLLNKSWQLSSHSRMLAYSYDVHNIGPNYIPDQIMKTYLIVYKKNNTVQFIKVSEHSFQLLEYILKEANTVQEIINELCILYSNIDKKQLTLETINLISLLYKEQTIF